MGRSKRRIRFKDADFPTVAGLRAVFQAEEDKYAKHPVQPDVSADYEYYQAWGYVLAGYFLLEESFKLLLHIRGDDVEPVHSLSKLFGDHSNEDKALLREYYRDFRHVADYEWDAAFPFADLDGFLVNLDGEAGGDEGSMHWRYFLIEQRNDDMPLTSIEFMHEIIRGTLNIAEFAVNPLPGEEPSGGTCTWRRHRERWGKLRHWIEDRINSTCPPEDGLEIAWGPDYANRCDLLLFKDGMLVRRSLRQIPDNPAVPLADVRKDVAKLLR